VKHGTESRFFTQPSGPKHRLYEALRALFVEGLPAKEVGERFDYCPQTLYVQASLFRAGKLSPFFVENRPGPKTRPMRDPVQENVIELRKKNYSIYDISHVLKEKKHNLSPRSVWEILHEAGFARLPRRLDEEKPALGPGPQPAPKADRRKLNLGPGQVFETAVAGLFLFLPDLVKMGIETCVEEARYPGTKTIPPLQYILSLVALKLLGRERYSHVMDCCHDVGLGLFAGLNAIPKTTALTTYSYRIVRAKNLGFLGALVQVGREKGAYNGESINLDFHAIPHFGEESVLEKHYVPRRSHAEKSVLVCLGHDLESRAFCYSNADIFHEDSADEVLRFAEFWKKATGEYPKELVFDSRFTTIKTLNRLNQMGIRFITLRRKSPKVIAELLSLPTASWRRCELDVPHRKYKNPRFYEGDI
jgi:transposase